MYNSTPFGRCVNEDNERAPEVKEGPGELTATPSAHQVISVSHW